MALLRTGTKELSKQPVGGQTTLSTCWVPSSYGKEDGIGWGATHPIITNRYPTHIRATCECSAEPSVLVQFANQRRAGFYSEVALRQPVQLPRPQPVSRSHRLSAQQMK